LTTPDHQPGEPRKVSPIGQRPGAPGRARVAGVIGSAIDRLEVQAERERIPWPVKGGSYDGMAPGGWRAEAFTDETGNIPEDCPVQPLGYEGETFYFIDTMGQVFSTQGKAMGVERMQILFAGHENFLYWAWPSFAKGGNVTNFKAEEARRDLYAACRKKGPWSPTDRVRGRGAWLDENGELILHCGEFLYRGGELEATGEHGEFFYARRPRTIAPWKLAVEQPEDNPAVSLYTVLCSWNFVRGNVDAFLFLGWLGVALMAGALEWRPSVFLVGDAGTGKSSLQNLVKEILGRGMIATTNATSAGLYQIVGHDTLPIGIDEIEGDDAGDQAQQIIKMARDAASGSMRIRGGADHKGVEFMARSAFLFSAINPPPINKASLSRLAMLQLRPLTGQKQPDLFDVDQIGPKLLRRVADHFTDFQRLLEDYKTVLHANGHSSRGQATFGTLLAAAHMLLGDEGMDHLMLPWEKLDQWGLVLSAEATPEVANSDPNWMRCMEAILTAPLDAFNKGERQTVGQVLWSLENDQDMVGRVNDARQKLAVCGLGIVDRGLAFEGYGLAIPLSGVDVAKLLQNTVWAGRGAEGSWANAISQGPEGIQRAKVPRKGAAHQGKPDDNRHTIGGSQRRCIFVGMKELWDWQEGGKK
jgi:hypothetical protein